MKTVETYLRELHNIRVLGAGVKETSYYPPLANLLNEVGRGLKPRVHCVINVRNQGAGLPDGGFFTPDQVQAISDKTLEQGPTPARGVLEVKGTRDDLDTIVGSDQIHRYWERYRQVLVTNLRDFALVGEDAQGDFAVLERCRLATSEAEFWISDPREFSMTRGDELVQYLKRVMLHAAPLRTPKDVAWFLASYARDAKARVERANVPALGDLRTALEQALGLRFEGGKGERFFRSTLVQTLFYGVFSAWILWSKKHPTNGRALFNWHDAEYELQVPMIRALFEQLAMGSRLAPLGLTEVLDWTTAALNRVDRVAFFGAFEEGEAVQYFYEPFLRHFDPELRKELGVWYTPSQIVRFMVERVDMVLRQDLGLPDGLADPNVYVLDPCTGTGSYLLEVLRRIERTLAEKGVDALTAYSLKRVALDRVFGFEILPAPFVVAHLQLGLFLQQRGTPLAVGERASVYLTNALTGWGPSAGPKQRLLAFPELEEERDASGEVKREKPILVVIGNPPYNAFAGVSPQEEAGLVELYKVGLNKPTDQGGWDIKKFNLDDLYVRFFRVAERRIAEHTGRGVVCFISNHSWISDPSFVVLRQHLLESFDRFWIENMHGDRTISEYAPDGRTSETIFAVPGFSSGIRQGVAVSLWVKNGRPDDGPRVLFRDDINAAKAQARRAQLLASLEAEDFDAHYEPAFPTQANRFSFRPSDVTTRYLEWPTLAELASFGPTLGVLENRKDALVSIDLAPLRERMRLYFDRSVEWADLSAQQTGLTVDAARFDAKKAREKVVATTKLDESGFRRLLVRPMEFRWAFYTEVRPLWNEPRPAYVRQSRNGNPALVSRRRGVSNPEGVPFYFTPVVGAQHALHKDAYYIPIQVHSEVNSQRQPAMQPELFGADLMGSAPPVANLSPVAREYLGAIGIMDVDTNDAAASLLWMHVLAIGYSPAYLYENADGIRQDWPRIPLPEDREVLLSSAALGRQVAALLDTQRPVTGVTTGAIRSELRDIGVVTRADGGQLNPDAGDLTVTAGWGRSGRGGVTSAASGRIERRTYTLEERTGIEEGVLGLGLTAVEAAACLGHDTFDVYLNQHAYWRNVPERVWQFIIGGFPVMRKWLSYRESSLLGRPLTAAEAHEVGAMARRLAALRLLEPDLDGNYQCVKAATMSR